MADDARYEVRLANGEAESAGSLWGARHVVARRVAFDPDPTSPRSALPAEIWMTGPTTFGRGVFVERIETAAELASIG